VAQPGSAPGLGPGGRKFESCRPDFIIILMKVCKYCLKDKSDEEFEVCRVVNGKIYRRLKCQSCKRKTTNERRSKLRNWLTEYKKTLACERCGFSDFRALEFHHHGYSKKDFTIANMIHSGQSKDTIEREIKKCIILCSNCHQIEHYMSHH
jgi:hypothetical protein